jgi:hypothetical protein
MDDISLSDVIGEISDQLLASEEQRLREGRPAIFLVGSIDIELSIIVTESKNRSGGVNLKVVKGDMSRQYQDQQVQRVTVHLQAAQIKGSKGQEAGLPAFESISSGLTPVRPRVRVQFDDE